MTDPTQIDHYQVVETLGKGSMGVLYRARDLSSGADVAIKILASELLSNARAVERFKREIRSTIQLEHPNLVLALAAGQFDGQYYYVMEFVEGANIKRHLRTKGRFELAQALQIATQVARALAYAGEFGLLHRDIKPENIILRVDGTAKLADLGLAKSMDSQNKLTLTGSVLGTPHYMSPEQARGEEDVDVRSDVYSLGATLYHMLAGRPPYEGDDPVSVLTRLLSTEPPALAQVNPRVPERVCRVVAKMMARERDRRYATAEELLHDLEHLEANEPTTVEREAGPTQRLAREQRYRYVPVLARSDLLFGRILVHSNAIPAAEMERALDRLERLSAMGIDLALANLLVDMTLLTRDQRALVEETVTKHTIQVGTDTYVRAVAKSEFLPAAKMAHYRQIQQESGRNLGQILFDAHEFTDEEKKIVRALQECLLTFEEDRQFLRVAMEQGFLGQTTAERSLVMQNNKAVQGEAYEVGQILVQKKLLPEDHRRVILRAIRRNGLTGRPIPELIAGCLLHEAIRAKPAEE